MIKPFKGAKGNKSDQVSKLVGKLIAEKAKAKGIETIVFR